MAEQNLEELQLENQKLKTDIAAQAKQLSDAGEHTAAIAKAKNSSDQVALEQLERSEILEAENEALKKRLAELEKVAIKHEAPSFEYNGDTYELLAPKVTIPGVGSVTAVDILATKALQEKLVKSESGLIRRKA